MNGKTITLATLAASLLIGTTAGGAFAQDRGDRRGPPRGGPEVMFVQMLQQFDTNKDGKISKEEATSAGDLLFASIDADKDGSITPGEMRKHRQAMRAEMQKARAEMKADAKPAPGDEAAVPPPPPGDQPNDQAAAPPAPPAPGDAPPQDMADAGPMDMGPGDMGPDGMAGGPRHHGKHHDGKRHGWHNERAERGEGRRDRGPDGMGGPARMMRVADKDENGQISKAEATAMGDRMFERMDRNKDGVISVDDLPKRPIFFR